MVHKTQIMEQVKALRLDAKNAEKALKATKKLDAVARAGISGPLRGLEKDCRD